MNSDFVYRNSKNLCKPFQVHNYIPSMHFLHDVQNSHLLVKPLLLQF